MTHTTHKHPTGTIWVIRNPEGLYWSNAGGWTDDDAAADRFTDEERTAYRPPIGGDWVAAGDDLDPER